MDNFLVKKNSFSTQNCLYINIWSVELDQKESVILKTLLAPLNCRLRVYPSVDKVCLHIKLWWYINPLSANVVYTRDTWHYWSKHFHILVQEVGISFKMVYKSL